ncbi:MAG TPA: PLP-dependent aminotransferase family protein [Caulobacteraceae bacterium]
MTNHASRWATFINASKKPAYLALADAIGEDIQSGELGAHEQLPPLRALAAALRLNFTTVARGYAEAKQRGLIDANAGRGTVVREFVRAPVTRPSPISQLDMTMNLPPEPRDHALIRQIRDGITSLAEQSDVYDLLRYQEFGGPYDDREAGASWLSRHIPDLTASRVLICPGIQSAILGLFASLARPRDTIACEAVTYPGVKGIAAQLGLRLVGLPLDDDGIDPDAFRALCRADPPKALYLNPTLQNPTTAVMSRARREAVAEIARTYAVPIIEDDAYGCLPVTKSIPLAVIAPELTFYVSGFSKVLGAGLRIGYIVTPNTRYTARISAALRTLVIMASPFMIRLATRFIRDGTVTAGALAIREEAQARQALAAAVLTGSTYVSKPEAFHLWLKVPEHWNRVEFANHLRANGVGLLLSDTFTVSGPPPATVRVGLGGASTREECQQMLEIINDALEHESSASFGGFVP